jgi:GNAT superfamily N-acetyltransferase
MKVRIGKKEDVGKLSRLYCSVWPNEVAGRVKRYFVEKVKRKEIFVAVDNDRIIGGLCFSKSWWKGADYIDEVVVDEGYRRKGVAAKLMGTFEKDAVIRRARRIFCSTQPSNRISIKMQMKLRYRKCGYVDNMFEEGKRELIFSKKL